MENGYAYKVVRVDEKTGELFSAVMSKNNKETAFCVTYKIGQWTYPRIRQSKLLVFRNLLFARNFRDFGVVKDGGYYRIFLCEVKNPQALCYLPPPHVSIKKARRFWKRVLLFLSPGIVPTPNGTMAVDAVKLLAD